MKFNKIISVISLFILMLTNVSHVNAAALPDFGSCLNPQGKIIASYDNGMHGVVGKSVEVSGSDRVYQSSDKGVTQCFCPEDGKGIQTNWYDVSKLSSKEVEVLKKDGWTYFATGVNWGLKDVPYLAKNSDYACRKNAPKKSKTTKVLSLASTGETNTIYTFIIAGAVFVIAGMITRKVSRK